MSQSGGCTPHPTSPARGEGGDRRSSALTICWHLPLRDGGGKEGVSRSSRLPPHPTSPAGGEGEIGEAWLSRCVDTCPFVMGRQGGGESIGRLHPHPTSPARERGRSAKLGSHDMLAPPPLWWGRQGGGESVGRLHPHPTSPARGEGGDRRDIDYPICLTNWRSPPPTSQPAD